MSRFIRIYNEKEHLSHMYDVTKDRKYLDNSFGIDVFFECETYKTYDIIKEFMLYNGFDKVYDIGCAHGYQSEIFLGAEIDYVGINETTLDFWNSDTYKYITQTYPFKIKTEAKDLAVSVLCLTWNCYLYEKDKTLHEQCSQLTKDFDNVILYMSNDKIEFVADYFKGYVEIDNNFVYFYN